MTATDTRTARTFSTANRVGLGLGAVLGLLDVAAPLIFPTGSPGEDGPPVGITVLGVVLGLVTLAAVYRAWTTGSRPMVRLIAGTRLLSMISGLPAFFVDVDAWIKVVVAVFAVLTLLCVGLMLRPSGRVSVTD